MTEHDKLSDEQFLELRKEQEKTHRPLQSLVVSKELVTDKDLTQFYADYAEIPFIELNPKEIDKEALDLIPERMARQYNAVVFKVEGATKYLAMEDPDDVQALDFIQKQIGSDYRLFIATKENVLQAIENYRDGVAEELSEVIAEQEENSEKQEAVSEEEIAEDSPVAQTVNLILEYAIRANASDIHIEPREDFLQVRCRIDGVLKELLAS